jgi:hypothetical protein
MRMAMLRRGRVTHPVPESLVPHALGDGDQATARHVEDCPTCRAEVARLREGAESLRVPPSLERLTETEDCLDELTVADFVDGRLGTETRGAVVTHLLTCARCRSVVRATGRLLAAAALAPELSGAGDAPAGRRWRRWWLPLGLAAAAAFVLLFLPRRSDDGLVPGLRDTTLTNARAPMPVAPRASVARVNRFVWSSVRGAARYRLRLYDGEGAVLWTRETGDTTLALPDSVMILPRVAYFWKVDAQTEWLRWVPSDLVEFRLVGSLQ